ncbi:MAG: hypothetical protein NTW95_11795 [Candidatus Aminicenantes bacterium]|nr:hypothetical protein [Candidatus Aminicenantes bacterium]
MKKRFFQLVCGLAVIGISSVALNAFWTLNDPECPFHKARTSMIICNSITESASQLLQSASEAFLFMNEVEIAEQNGLNMGAALQRIDLAAAKVEQALKIFYEIIAVGSESSYKLSRINKLREFNYEQYARDNSLNLEAMNRVGDYLKKGDVLGFYRFHADNLEALLNILNQIKQDLLAGRLSDKKVLWSLLQQYTTIMMTGNYASLVFYQI